MRSFFTAVLASFARLSASMPTAPAAAESTGSISNVPSIVTSGQGGELNLASVGITMAPGELLDGITGTITCTPLYGWDSPPIAACHDLIYRFSKFDYIQLRHNEVWAYNYEGCRAQILAKRDGVVITPSEGAGLSQLMSACVQDRGLGLFTASSVDVYLGPHADSL